jgi:hypothetical protein
MDGSVRCYLSNKTSLNRALLTHMAEKRSRKVTELESMSRFSDLFCSGSISVSDKSGARLGEI